MRNLILFIGCALLFSCAQKAPVLFEQLSSSQTGIDFVNEIIEKDTFNILRNEYMYNGGGVGVADLNNDGLQDLIFTGNKVSSRIYLNKGGFKFQDITDKFEGLTDRQWISGVAAVDINADGWTDLYFTSTMNGDSLLRKNQLWIHQGLGDDQLPHFKEEAEKWGIADMGPSMHAAFLDYDLDGDLDLYILHNIVSKEVPNNYHDKVTDGSAANNDRFYRNEGNGHFTEITKEAGIVYEGFGLGIAVGDVNKDGYPDLYISNDYISNDLLYINQGDGTFRNEIADYFSYQSKFSMGNDIADVNNDGCLDVMTLDMMPEAYFRKKQTINGNSYTHYNNDRKYGYEHQYVRNMLHLHSGFRNGQMLPFSEVGQMTGLYQTEWSWSALFADYDNDGDKDLLITNGFPKDLTDKDFTNYKAQMYGYLEDDKGMISKIPVVKVANYAFENIGELNFKDQTKAWGLDLPSFTNGAVFVDLDNDGDLDYVTNNINDPAFIFKNNTRENATEKPNYLRISLVGTDQNLAAIGAKVELWCGGQVQYHEHFLSRGYLSSVDPIVHFGLGKNAVADSIRVVWPRGHSASFLTNVPANQTLLLKEAEALPFDKKNLIASTNYLFMPDKAIDYTHQQPDYIDFFQSQRIIQHKFSQVGPCMAKGDLDGDGREDLFIGGGEETAAVVFLNKGDYFEKSGIPGLTDQKGCLESDIIIFDIDKDGDNDLIALAGGYAHEDGTGYRHYLYRNHEGTFVKEELPIPPFPASIIRIADFDKDGDMDLFIGARVQRMSFPLAPPSYLLINENGFFSKEKTLPLDLGMVTDATWSDFDSDGYEDLIVAREWNSIAILKNKKGQSLEPFGEKELEGKRGFWYAIAAADLDGDGDDDYILGNLGENHRFHISDEYPMCLYAIDVDKNEMIDPITTAFWKDKNGKMQEYPVNYLDELASQSPFFRKKFTSYTQFSYTPIDSIIHRASVKPEEKRWVNTCSSFILWNEGGQLTWERLPAAVQVAPLRKILVQDFNGDTQPDILLLGNDHSFDVSTGNYDANRGIVLLGKGGRKFEVLPPAKAGLGIRGQVESVVYFGGDTPRLIIGLNRQQLRSFKLSERTTL